MKKRQTVVIGLLGTTLDQGSGVDRWQGWRPTLSIVRQEDFLVHRFHLLYDPASQPLAQSVMEDMALVSPETQAVAEPISFGGDPWDFSTVYAALHDFARRFAFQPEGEDYYLHITTGTHVAQICLFLLAESRHIPAKLLQTRPAKRTIRGDIQPGDYSIIDLDLARYDALAARFANEATEARVVLKSGIPTRNAAFNALIERIERVAVNSQDPILLTGPTGSGKSQLARRVYELRVQRAAMKGKFIEINCATLRGDTAMSTLFGHIKGSYTGATADRPGLLREADGGMLFLDEIGELGLDEQAMLLRALEDQEFHPFGSDKLVRSAFQVIAGTNRDLEDRVREGRFREDLLARLNLWTFQLPGLAERREDIGPNLDYELERFAQRNGRKVTFNKEARETFLRFANSAEAHWSGNFRDLNAAVTRLATLATQGRITEALVGEEVARLTSRWQKLSGQTIPQQYPALQEMLGAAAAELDPFDAVQLDYVLQICRTSKNTSEAGRRLFSVSRQAKANTNDTDRLRKYLARFGLDWEKVKAK